LGATTDVAQEASIHDSTSGPNRCDRDQGTGAGEIGVAGSNVSFGGTLIGSFAGGAGSVPPARGS
jgi:hypothetical protein